MWDEGRKLAATGRLGLRVACDSEGEGEWCHGNFAGYASGFLPRGFQLGESSWQRRTAAWRQMRSDSRRKQERPRPGVG